MTAEEKLILKTLYSAGSAGVKKTDLRKEFGDVEAVVEELVSRGEIFVDKRAGAYYYFHRSNYIQSLLNTDPRFKLTYDLLRSIDETVSRLANNVSNLSRFVLEMKNEQQSSVFQQQLATATSPSGVSARPTMSASDFKTAFDAALSNSASSIGWVELAKIRNELCEKCGLSADEFYRLVGDLTGQNQDKYELSTGGAEGVMVRGLLHGFVRCI
jgi:polyhydroxyalkanoate synthesis regulator phasin